MTILDTCYHERKNEKAESCRIGSVGGQAVLEGVMMKSRDRYSVAVRLESGDIDITTNRTVPLKNKYKILGWPLIRGVVIWRNAGAQL